MSGDLSAAVEALHDPVCACPGDGSDPDCNWHPGSCPVLALIPEGAVLVTEETLAAALEIDWSAFWIEEPQTLSEYASGTTTVHFDRDAFAAAILRHLREGT